MEPAQKPGPLCLRGCLEGEAWLGEQTNCSYRNSLGICTSQSPPSSTAQLCWAPAWRHLTRNNMTLPGRTPKKIRSMPPVCWMLNSMPARARKWTPHGTHAAQCQPIGAADGIALRREWYQACWEFCKPKKMFSVLCVRYFPSYFSVIYLRVPRIISTIADFQTFSF